MSAGNWSINGMDLVDVGVRVVPTRLTAEQRLRQVQVAIHDDEDVREMVGADLPTIQVEMQFHGRGDGKFDVLAFVQGILETDEVFTLTAPALKPAFVFKNFKRAALSCEAWTFDSKKATGSVALTFTSIVNGIWITDGGTFCEQVVGHFLQVTANTYERDDGVVTALKPLLTLPMQTTGYPQAIKNDYTTGQPPLYASDATTQTFDMTDYLTPALAGVNSVGVYEVCSSPADPGGGIGNGQQAGTGAGLREIIGTLLTVGTATPDARDVSGNLLTTSVATPDPRDLAADLLTTSVATQPLGEAAPDSGFTYGITTLVT